MSELVGVGKRRNAGLIPTPVISAGRGPPLASPPAAAMDMTPAMLDKFEKLMPAIEPPVRITGQVERFAKPNMAVDGDRD